MIRLLDVSLLDSAHVHHKPAVEWFRSVGAIDASLTGSRQTTDAYLAGLAHHKGGRLATLDSGIAWRAVRNARSELIENILA
jgi:hypothetical protein